MDPGSGLGNSTRSAARSASSSGSFLLAAGVFDAAIRRRALSFGGGGRVAPVGKLAAGRRGARPFFLLGVGLGLRGLALAPFAGAASGAAFGGGGSCGVVGGAAGGEAAEGGGALAVGGGFALGATGLAPGAGAAGFGCTTFGALGFAGSALPALAGARAPAPAGFGTTSCACTVAANDNRRVMATEPAARREPGIERVVAMK